MSPWYRAAGILLLCVWIGIFPCQRLLAANDEELKLLLQKGLTLFEIDQELARIQLEEAHIIKQMAAAEQELQAHLTRSEETKRHAAKVLRAYYIGDRASLWLLLLTISSFKDAMTTLDYLQMIIGNDYEALKKHSESQLQLTERQQALASAQAALAQTKERFNTQRAQMVQLQKQLDEDVSKQKEAALIVQQMAQLTMQWQEKGIPLFKTYFQALSTALKQLPEIIAEDSKGMTKHLIMNGFHYTFQITDGELNQFLRSKNSLFQNMIFRFTDTELVATGTQDGIAVAIKGLYELSTKGGEGSGKTVIRFKMTQLEFNGFDLPRSTVEAMEQQFDLGIDPRTLASFLTVTGLKLEAGKLSIMLKMSL